MVPALALAAILQDGLQLTYETSGGKSSGDYAESLAFCRRLERLSPFVHVASIGKSGSGRDMVAVTVSKEGVAEPATLHASGKPLIYIENGIHAGEIEGKDATLLLLRDMLVTKTRASLLDCANFLIVPVLNVDGHERRSPYNRINQNGPTEMGWRANDQNLNLNRDWIKLDAPETRAAVAIQTKYAPDFYVDNHTTDGANYPYVAMLGVPSTPSLDPHIAQWAAGLYSAVSKELSEEGVPTCPYFEFNGDDPARGIYVQDYSPRYSTGYWGARNRPSMLIETHMLKPYRTRVAGTYQAMVRAIEYVGHHRRELREAIDAADAQDRDGAGAFYVLGSQVSDAKRKMPFLLYEAKPYRSEITGTTLMGWTEKRVDAEVDIQDQFVPSAGAKAPGGYAIPAALGPVIEVLKAHGLRLETSSQPLTDSFETYAFSDAKIASASFEGRNMASFKVEAVTEDRTLPSGTVFVACDQPGTRLLLHLLEPGAPDSLVRWGFLNAFFERKEYFEPYAMEPVAQQMLKDHPELRPIFEDALKDPKFAADPYARLMWFYDRSPYADARLNRYPIVRLSAQQVARLRS